MSEFPKNFPLLDEYHIKYEIKPVMSLHIRIHFNRDGILVINYPLTSKYETVENLIIKHLDWILEKSKLAKERMITYETNSYHYYLGEKYQLKINYSRTERIDVINKLILLSKHQETDTRSLLINWRIDQANIIFNELLYQCFKTMEKDLPAYPRLIIKGGVSKWGCCYTKENKIMLNYALTQAPLDIIKYVIYHELTHFIIPNHSTLYHEVLKKYVPNEKELRQQLKKYNSKL